MDAVLQAQHARVLSLRGLVDMGQADWLTAQHLRLKIGKACLEMCSELLAFVEHMHDPAHDLREVIVPRVDEAIEDAQDEIIDTDGCIRFICDTGFDDFIPDFEEILEQINEFLLTSRIDACNVCRMYATVALVITEGTSGLEDVREYLMDLDNVLDGVV